MQLHLSGAVLDIDERRPAHAPPGEDASSDGYGAGACAFGCSACLRSSGFESDQPVSRCGGGGVRLEARWIRVDALCSQSADFLDSCLNETGFTYEVLIPSRLFVWALAFLLRFHFLTDWDVAFYETVNSISARRGRASQKRDGTFAIVPVRPWGRCRQL
jgi:hypothetical protein